jgi:hypothetical protein
MKILVRSENYPHSPTSPVVKFGHKFHPLVIDSDSTRSTDRMNLPIVPHQQFASSPVTEASNRDETKLRVLVQPNDVQVKRVGRASCIEPDVKLCVEMDSPYPKTIAVNAYLKVVGKDNKDKLILLRRSDDITFSKTHKREIIGMKLRFLKTIKVQVLKRNLGVSRPEASIVFEAVGKENEFEGACSTSHFAIISDPRYLDEVKHRRANERHEPLSDDDYHPTRRIKRRKIDTPSSCMYPNTLAHEYSFIHSPSSHTTCTLYPTYDSTFNLTFTRTPLVT